MGSRGVFKKESYVDTSPYTEDEEKMKSQQAKRFLL